MYHNFYYFPNVLIYQLSCKLENTSIMILFHIIISMWTANQYNFVNKCPVLHNFRVRQ